MSEKKSETKIEQKNDPKNELEGIDVDFLVKVDKLNGKFFETLDNLKEARPTFQGIDEAFLSVSENLLNAYQLVYKLLYEQYRGEIERVIAFYEAKNDRIIPYRWKRWWQRRFRQNQAMNLVDKEADYEAMSAFAAKEHELYEKYLKAPDESEDAEEWEAVGELDEDPAEGTETASEGAEQTESGEEGAPAEDPAEGAESAPETTYKELVKKVAKKVFSKVENSENKEKGKEAPAESVKTASVSDSDGEELKKDGEKVESSAENASESVFETVQEGKNRQSVRAGKRRRRGKRKMPYVKAIRLDKTDELYLKILNAMFDEENHAARVKYGDLASKFGELEETIRYNIGKLKRLGYIREKDNKYEPTEKVILLKKK